MKDKTTTSTTDRTTRCGTLYPETFSEHRCSRRAVAVLDAGTEHTYPVCADCARTVRDARRLTPLTTSQGASATGGCP
jgi:hypothetical protein